MLELELRDLVWVEGRFGEFLLRLMLQGWVSKLGSILWSFFLWGVPYYIGDPKRDPGLENYLEWIFDYGDWRFCLSQWETNGDCFFALSADVPDESTRK